MTPEDDSDLWELLGKSPARPVSPFFARNVLRAVRDRLSLLQRMQLAFGRRKVLVLASAVAVVVTVSAITLRPVNTAQTGLAATESTAQVEETDDEIMLDVDDLVAADDTSAIGDIWAL